MPWGFATTLRASASQKGQKQKEKKKWLLEASASPPIAPSS